MRPSFGGVGIALEGRRVRNLRSALTMLGIVVGVAPVIAMVAIGSGTATWIDLQIASLGRADAHTR